MIPADFVAVYIDALYYTLLTGWMWAIVPERQFIEVRT